MNIKKCATKLKAKEIWMKKQKKALLNGPIWKPIGDFQIKMQSSLLHLNLRSKSSNLMNLCKAALWQSPSVKSAIQIKNYWFIDYTCKWSLYLQQGGGWTVGFMLGHFGATTTLLFWGTKANFALFSPFLWWSKSLGVDAGLIIKIIMIHHHLFIYLKTRPLKLGLGWAPPLSLILLKVSSC